MARWKGKYQLPFNCLRFLLLGELSSRVELPLSNSFLYCCLTCSTTDVTIYSWAWLRKLKSTLKLKVTVTFELTTIYLANIFWGRLLKKKKKWFKQIKETKRSGRTVGNKGRKLRLCFSVKRRNSSGRYFFWLIAIGNYNRKGYLTAS